MALLKGKAAVITGGSTGIGLSTAKRFVEEGAYVFINGRSQAELDAAVKEIGVYAAIMAVLRSLAPTWQVSCRTARFAST